MSSDLSQAWGTQELTKRERSQAYELCPAFFALACLVPLFSSVSLTCCPAPDLQSPSAFPFLCANFFPLLNLSTAVLILFFLPQNTSLCNFLNCIILPLLLDILTFFQSKGWCSPTPLLSLVGKLLCICSSISGISPRKRRKGHSQEIAAMVSAQSRPLGLKVTCS